MKTYTLEVHRQQFAQPCTYQFIDKEGAVIYVGCSALGFTRAFNHQSNSKEGDHGSRRRRARELANIIVVSTFDSLAEAQANERRLIEMFQPKYNREGRTNLPYTRRPSQPHKPSPIALWRKRNRTFVTN